MFPELISHIFTPNPAYRVEIRILKYREKKNAEIPRYRKSLQPPPAASHIR